MTHLHKASGMKFECGELMEFPVNGARQTYDMTVITLWYDPSEDDVLPPVIIGYYFGEYNPEHTDYYIDQWLKNVTVCKDIVEAYWVTNEDVLEGDWREKALSAVNLFDNLRDTLQVIQNGGNNNE